jgi:glycosyltransferase involved in cell wall biosynthesis
VEIKTPALRTFYLAKRWLHHTASGGYDRMAKETGGLVVRREPDGGVIYRAARLAWRKLSGHKPYLMDYQYGDWVAEWKMMAQSRLKHPDVVHALYGDEQLDVLLRRRKLLGCALVATFHLPTDREGVKTRFERWQKDLMGGLDAAIVVSRCQLPDFQRWLGAERVSYIPHGIDTEKFSPGTNKPRTGKVRLLTVGEHMRDWETLHRVMDECRDRKLPVEFDVVAAQKCSSYLSGCTNARLHSGISEECLIELYREADALLLPVTDATANNSVLESVACGTPVISTAVGGIPDYVDEKSGWLFPKREAEGILALIKTICDDREAAGSRRAGARTKAMEFDWRVVGRQAGSVYEAACRRFAAR